MTSSVNLQARDAASAVSLAVAKSQFSPIVEMFARAVGSGASNELRLGRTDHVVSVGETVLMKPHHPSTPLYIAQIATMFDCM